MNTVATESRSVVIERKLSHPPAKVWRALTQGALIEEWLMKNDFQAVWQEAETVAADSTYRTNYGKIHYLQILIRDHPLVMRPGQVYRLVVEFDPDIARVEA